MPITTLSARAFNQETGRAKKATADGPVFITERGRPAHVLLTIEDYRRITGQAENIADLLAMPATSVDLDLPARSECASLVNLE
jgi:prevent-host-death family protein